MRITKEDVGKRFLLKSWEKIGLSDSYFEAKVLEVTPDEEQVKLQYITSDVITWKDNDFMVKKELTPNLQANLAYKSPYREGDK